MTKKGYFCVLFSCMILVSCNRKEVNINSSSVFSSEPSIVSQEESSQIIASSQIPSQTTTSVPISVSSELKPVEQKDMSKITGFYTEPAASPVPKNDILFEFKGNTLEKELLGDIYFYAGRLYLEPMKIIALFREKFQLESNIEFNFSESIYLLNGVKVPFTQPFQMINSKEYVSLYDISCCLGLNLSVDRNSKIIIFYERKELFPQNTKLTGGKQALLRLEDFCASPYTEADYFLKCRTLTDYLKSKGVLFSVAFIPQYVNPVQKTENDPSRDYSLLNIDFIYTLDYMIRSGGKIGLHGYTHQRENEISGEGFEFGPKISTEETAGRFEKAIGVMKRLNIEYSFFEFPHYSGTEEQYKLAERYFDILYNPPKTPPKSKAKIKTPYRAKAGERTVLYLDTPIDYLRGETEADMNVFLSRVNNNSGDTLASMFFHPYMETKYIKTTRENGMIQIDYHPNSPLNRIITCFEKNGYSFVEPGAIK